VLLGISADHERGNVHELLANADVTVADKNAGVVNRLGVAGLENAGLETTLEESLDVEGEEHLKLVLGLVDDAHAKEAAEKSRTLENALGVTLLKNEKRASLRTDGGEGELSAPDLTLVLETEAANELELTVHTLTVIGTTRVLDGLVLVTIVLHAKKT
jgi:hypothetical protein